MLTLALDATYAAHPEPTGIGVYCERLITALAKLGRVRETLQFRLLLCFRPGPYWRWARHKPWPPGCSMSPLLEFWPRPSRAELFHGLNQRLTGTRYAARVVTVHDLFPLTSAEYSKPDFQRHFSDVLRRTIARADRIIAVSDATRQQLLRHTDARDETIRVVHHGVVAPQMPSRQELDNFRKQVLGLQPGEKFFLSVGDIQIRKNIANIVLAFGKLTEHRLVLAGGNGHGAQDILTLIEREGLSRRIIRLGHTPMEQLRLLYSTAHALVFPSLEEGFGMPILEAMSYGLPVITSNCSSMPEVAGSAALLVDPCDVSQISEAMRRVAQDSALAADLQRRGLDRAQVFSWERCARETWEVYREILNPGG